MNVLFVSPEIAPFAKTGGLGDVSGALPKALAALGHEVAAVMPYYPQARAHSPEPSPTGLVFTVAVGDTKREATVYRSTLPNSCVPVYFVANSDYYDRPGLFRDSYDDDYPDNSERFIFFSRAACEIARRLPARPHVIHCNDWQTALVPVYLKTFYRGDDRVAETATVLTIHNVAYQGAFWHWDMKLTGLDWSLYNWRELECHGRLNFLKAGIVFADLINTVSRTYAAEILSEPGARGLSAALRAREADLHGIMNGVDYSLWNPTTDPVLPARYSVDSMAGKRTCKATLQQVASLPAGERPLLAMVARLAAEKGIDILLAAADRLMDRDLQFVLLGTGHKRYEAACADFARRYPSKAAALLTFDDALAHVVVAGADAFLMPSLTEPAGLTQLYSLKYGTLPIVRRTGGLCDTVTPYAPGGSPDHATGFGFDAATPEAMLDSVDTALGVYARPPDWTRLVRTGMQQDWSWDRSAKEYADLYAKAVAKSSARHRA